LFGVLVIDAHSDVDCRCGVGSCHAGLLQILLLFVHVNDSFVAISALDVANARRFVATGVANDLRSALHVDVDVFGVQMRCEQVREQDARLPLSYTPATILDVTPAR
jgi:hypothetical protein